MFGGDDYGPDDTCDECGAPVYFNVGFNPICETCGEPLHKVQESLYDPSDEDVLLDARYITFDKIAAFRYLRDRGLLDQFCGDYYD